MILGGKENAVARIIGDILRFDGFARKNSVEAGAFKWGASGGNSGAGINIGNGGSFGLIEIIHSIVDFGFVAIAGFHFADIFHESKEKEARALFFADSIGNFEGVGGIEGGGSGVGSSVFGGDITNEVASGRFGSGISAGFDVFVVSFGLTSLAVGASFFDFSNSIDANITAGADFVGHNIVKIGFTGIVVAIGTDLAKNFRGSVVIIIGSTTIGSSGEGGIKFGIIADSGGEIVGSDGLAVIFEMSAVYSNAIFGKNGGGVGGDGAIT